MDREMEVTVSKVRIMPLRWTGGDDTTNHIVQLSHPITGKWAPHPSPELDMSPFYDLNIISMDTDNDDFKNCHEITYESENGVCSGCAVCKPESAQYFNHHQ